jgi:hypothetical protein
MIQVLLSAGLGNEDPQRQRRGVTTFAGLAEVAAQVGLNIKNLDWDGGELLWAAKILELADQA